MALVNRLRAWYWHFEVERLALARFYDDSPFPVEAKLKTLLCLVIVHMIRFFVEDEALLLAPAETEQNNLKR
jgi:hypothetical protein